MEYDDELESLRLAVHTAQAAPSTPVRVRNRLMDAVRQEEARLAGSDAGREALRWAALYDEDRWVRLHAALGVERWDPGAAAEALVALVAEAGGTVIRPMTMDVALAVDGGVGWNAALCLMNIDEDRSDEPDPEPPRQLEPGTTVPSDLLDAAESVYSLAMSGGLDHAYEVAGDAFGEAAAGFSAVGAPAAGDVLRSALTLLGGDPAAEIEARAAQVAAMTKAAYGRLEALSAQFQGMADLMDLLEGAPEGPGPD